MPWTVWPCIASMQIDRRRRNFVSSVVTTDLVKFLQPVSIACYAKRCISYSKSVRQSVCLSVCLSVTRWHWVKTTQATIMGSSLEDSPMTLVSSRLTSWQNSKGNIESEGAEWESGRKNRQFLANKSGLRSIRTSKQSSAASCRQCSGMWLSSVQNGRCG